MSDQLTPSAVLARIDAQLSAIMGGERHPYSTAALLNECKEVLRAQQGIAEGARKLTEEERREVHLIVGWERMPHAWHDGSSALTDWIERKMDAAVAAETEQCAKIMDALEDEWAARKATWHDAQVERAGRVDGARYGAIAIRGRLKPIRTQPPGEQG